MNNLSQKAWMKYFKPLRDLKQSMDRQIDPR